MADLTDLELEGELGAHASCSRSLGGRMAYSRPFALAGDQPHYAPDLVVDVLHIKLEIAIDPKKKYVAGTATHTVQAINEGVRSIKFDAAEMQISGVNVNGAAAKFDYSDPVLRVDLARALKAGASTEIAISYSAYPRRGLYFTAPTKDYPKKPLQAWTQGQDEDSRHWYPCIDFPNHQQTSEVIVTVPGSMISIGNGELKA